MRHAVEVVCASAAETEALGAALGRAAMRVMGVQAMQREEGRRRRRAALTVLLRGGLGSGKTTLVRGFVGASAPAGAGARQPGVVTSPTFLLQNVHPLVTAKSAGNAGAELLCQHIDLYRIGTDAAMWSACARLGLSQCFEEPDRILLIEWPERMMTLLKPKTWLDVHIEDAEGGAQEADEEPERLVHLEAHGGGPADEVLLRLVDDEEELVPD